ncbi:MAG: hypothetical protein JST17_11050 [Bacteroidetes bacterium]|nr:hypothetical protein [Bacteroidota bacterium]MBS1930073.1 hypothetical protein [Bacteroidota bacterium]
MSSSLDKLNQHIDQLVIWLRQNQNVKLLSAQKDRLTNVLNKIINTEILSEEEIKQLDEQLKKQKQPSIENGYTFCPHCGDKLNRKNIERHKQKCRGQKQTAKAAKKSTQKKKATSKRTAKRKRSSQPRAHIVRGGLPSLGKRR